MTKPDGKPDYFMRITEINYMSLNELINMIYNFDFGTHTNLNLFSRDLFHLRCDLQFDEVCLCKQR